MNLRDQHSFAANLAAYRAACIDEVRLARAAGREPKAPQLQLDASSLQQLERARARRARKAAKLR